MRRVVVAWCAFTLALAGCGGGGGGGPAQTFSVQLDGKADAFNGVFPAFFPSELKAHPGDSITFALPHFNGEPHTVTLGRLVDAAAAKLAKLGPSASPRAQEDTPEMSALPAVFPQAISRAKEQYVGNQSAVNPCFIVSDQPANSFTGAGPGCPPATQPAFDGKMSFFGLGAFISDGTSKTVQLSSSIRPGAYSLMCMVHRGLMIGRIVVVAKDKTVPSPSEQTSKGLQELGGLVSALEPATQTLAKATANRALAGAGIDSSKGLLVAQFAPPTIQIKAGGTVSWMVRGMHSISFGVSTTAIGVLQSFARGIDYNEDAVRRTGPPLPPSAAVDFPPQEGITVIDYDGGTYNGSGMYTTGVLRSLAPSVVTYHLKFAKRGTYAYRCVVHPAMSGRVTVS